MNGLEQTPDAKAGAQISLDEAKKRFGATIWSRTTDERLRQCKGHKYPKLSFEVFKDTVLQPCTYCGEVNVRLAGSEIFPIAELDRTDPDRGYVRANVVPACRYCNYMKGRWTRERFLKKIERIQAHRGMNVAATDST